MIELTTEELSRYNGKDGAPVYIAHEGKIYDVTESPMWKTGSHMRRHLSGKDLTADFSAAPHGREVFDRYPQVGVVRAQMEPPAEGLPECLELLFKRVPFLRRHPHPMTVHFPIALLNAAVFFTLLYLVTGHLSFDTTAFHCLTAGLLLTPFVMATGFVSWWVNYLAKPVPAVRIKMAASLVLLVFATAAYLVRAAVPGILHPFGAASMLYLLLLLPIVPLVGVIGWNGAKLTFPTEVG